MKLIRLFNRIIVYCFYLLFTLTPFIFNPSRTIPSFELFEWNKMMFVYALTLIIVTAWIGKMIILKKFLIKRTVFDIPILLFVGSQILSTLFSIDRHVSFFGYYSRFHGGLLSTISYALLYFAFTTHFYLFNVSRLVGFILTSASLVASYGILEKFGIDAHMWVQDVRARVFSTLGQPNWLAAFIAILLPLSIHQVIYYLQNKTKLHANKLSKFKAQNSKLFVIWHLIFVILLYVCLLFTRSRSGFLGFWTADAFFWTYVWWSQKKSLKRIIPIFALCHAIFIICNFFFTTPFPQYNRIASIEIMTQPAPIVETAPAGDSIINVGITDSADIRRIVWKGAVAIAKDYPLFGTGPETFAYAYYKYRPVEHNLTSEWDFLYNRAHNEYLNMAATSGFIGLGAYGILIATVLLWTLNQLWRKKYTTYNILVSAFLAGYLSILVTNFFGFSVVVVGLYFFLIPAFLISLRYPNQTITSEVNQTTFSIGQKASLAILLIISASLLYTLAGFWIADSLYARAYSLRRQEQYQPAYTAVHNALTLRASEPVYLDEAAILASHLSLIAISEENDATTAASLTREAVETSSAAIEISPQNVNFWKNRTRILYNIAQLDPAFLSSAIESLLIATELAPTDPKITYNMAVLLGEVKRNSEAIEWLQKTIELKPDYRDAYIALSIFYENEKQIDKAIEILEQVLTRINPQDQEVTTRINELKSKQ